MSSIYQPVSQNPDTSDIPTQVVLIDLSWGSSVLEGGTYSALDTEALIQYGQRNKNKPTADAVLVLNHKRAAEYLWANRAVIFLSIS